MNKEDVCSKCSPEIFRDEDNSDNWDGECCNCEYFDGDDDDLMSIFSMAEIWFSDGKDEDYMFGYTEEELEDALDDHGI